MASSKEDPQAENVFLPDGVSCAMPREGARRQRCRSYKTALCASITVNVVLMIALVVLGIFYRQSHHSMCCPPGWTAHHEKCFFFSEEEKSWNASQRFCTLKGASLTTLDTELLEFFNNCKLKHIYWIGLRRDSGGPWKWTNGENYNKEIVGQGGGDCAYLNDELKPSTSRCRLEHRWICSKAV